jgi:hypothetical protein
MPYSSARMSTWSPRGSSAIRRRVVRPEFFFRDAKQFTGLSDCQARSQAKRDLHFKASLRAVPFAKREARQQNGHCDQAFSMASLKRRAFNQHLLDRICEHLANGQSLEKSSPDYETLCNYGIMADEAA